MNYYSEKDIYVIKQVDMKGRRERKSRSAVIIQARNKEE
jgi:hypothetical protein